MLAPSTTVAAVAHPSTSAQAPPAYVLEGTEVRTIHADQLNRDYPIFVSLPVDYAEHPERRYPVMFVTDANYAFPLIRSIARRLGGDGGTEDFILVGLGYATGDTPVYSRRRDYTPTDRKATDLTSDMPGKPVVHGEADGYRAYLKQSVLPAVAKYYRADMSRTIYVGHSYGGLLGWDIVIHDPTMFQHYILGSPSLWFDHRVEFNRLREAVAGRHDLPANVLVVVGSYETIAKDPSDRRYDKGVDMISDNRAFVAQLNARHFPNLHMHLYVAPDEDHGTVFPTVITKGILWALPGERTPFFR